jgi:predicted DNA-binding transcriptional regulator AlpA
MYPYDGCMPTATAPKRTRPPYARGAKKGTFELDVYDVRELVERTGLTMEVIIRSAREGDLPGRKFLGHAGWRFPHSAVMWWLAGSPGIYDPLMRYEPNLDVVGAEA